MELQGKIALVTGASSGICQAIAIAFAKRRAHVLVHYGRNKAGAQDTLAEVAKYSSDRLYQADLMDRDQIASVFAAIKQTIEIVDVLVNNAGDAKPGDIGDDQIWDYEYKNSFCPPCRLAANFWRCHRRVCARSSTSPHSMATCKPASRNICSTPPSRPPSPA